MHSQYTDRHGLWWAPGDKLVVPDADSLRQDVLREMHDSPYAGHTGVNKTRRAIEQFYTWPSLKDDVAHWVRTCAGCQHNKLTNQPVPTCSVPTCKWGSVSMDLIKLLCLKMPLVILRLLCLLTGVKWWYNANNVMLLQGLSSTVTSDLM